MISNYKTLEESLEEAGIMSESKRKRDNRIIALQCAVANTVNSDNTMNEVVDFAKRFEKYLEHGE